MKAQHPLLREELAHIAALELPYEQLQNKAIAVTGATGLVGGYLVRALDAVRQAHHLNLRLILLCRDPEMARRRLEDVENAEFLPYDARRKLDLALEANYIFHAASNAHPLSFSGDPVGTMQANLLGTMNLLEQIRQGGGRLILLSTGEIYGEDPRLTDGFDEMHFGSIDPMAFRSCYPESKRAAETLCAAYARQYGVDALAARLTYVYGALITKENSRADAQFLRRAANGENIVLKSLGNQFRSYCYAADATSALITLMFRGQAATAYNVSAPGCEASIRRYAEILAELAGVEVHFELPPDAEREGYSAVKRAVLKADRLLGLGWRPAYNLQEGLRRTLAISRWLQI